MLFCDRVDCTVTLSALQIAGVPAGYDFMVACYDWRVSPFQDVASDGPHLERARELVEQAYRNTGQPVYLMGHSNGGLQALALLNNSSPEWKAKHIGKPYTLFFKHLKQRNLLFQIAQSALTWMAQPARTLQTIDCYYNLQQIACRIVAVVQAVVISNIRAAKVWWQDHVSMMQSL